MITVLGSFDGFHKGHQSLFAEAIRLADAGNTFWSVLTFSPHPQCYFSPDNARLLFTEDERNIISRYLEIPRVTRLPFDKGLAQMSPEHFLEYIAERYSLSGIVVGDNFKFGRDRTGNIDFLQSFCSRSDLNFSHVSTMSISGTPISSTMIRGLVSCGEMEKAAELLGYCFFISGKVIRGDGRGRKLGYPTANLQREPHKVVPAEGVYASAVFFNGRYWPAAVNIGYNPSFGSLDEIRIEAHISGFEGNIYGQTLNIVFMKRIRGELAFRYIDDLKRQIAEDSDVSRQVFQDRIQEIPRFFQRFSESVKIP